MEAESRVSAVVFLAQVLICFRAENVHSTEAVGTRIVTARSNSSPLSAIMSWEK